MFAYSVDNLPSSRPSVWSYLSLQPLAPGALTPFSFSVLSEVLARAWYLYYDALGFEPKTRSHLLRQYNGRAYLQISQSAALEADLAGVEPMAYRVNGQEYPVAAWVKPGLLTGIRSGRARRKIAETMESLAADVEQITDRSQVWAAKTHDMSWGQAELLQVMEQIERVSLPSFELFLVARHNLEWAYNRLLCLTQEAAPFPDNLILINNALRDVDLLVENDMAERMLAMSELAETNQDVVHWLKGDDFNAWQTELPSKDVRNALEEFLATYGHRCTNEGEMQYPRWHENATPILKGILACANKSPKHPTRMPVAQNAEKLTVLVEGKQRQETLKLLERARAALRLQSQALNAVAFILDGTRQWALAAAAEAMADGRLSDPSDIFFFELEEIKQMMTGEWNVNNAEQIRATAKERREAHARWRGLRAPDLLFDDLPAKPVINGLPGAAGRATGPLRRWDTLQPHVCNGAVVGVEQLSSGWSIVLPVARGILTATGTPIDPVVAAARAWNTPIMVALGEEYDALVEGAQTTIDTDRLIVDQ